MRDDIRANAEKLAEAAGAKIETIAKAHVRKEDVVAAVIRTRGDPPGRVPVISVMEACSTDKAWHDKRPHQTFLRPASGKGRPYSFDFIDPELGLVSRRVPTGCPFRLQFDCNGHRGLARPLPPVGIDYAVADNAFIRIDDRDRVPPLADRLSPDGRHRMLDRDARHAARSLTSSARPLTGA